MSETVEIKVGDRKHEAEMTDELRGDLSDIGFHFPDRSEEALAERVKEILYSLVEVEPREALGRNEVKVSDDGEATLDHGQPQKLDHADDVEIRMVRPDGITVGWSDNDE